MRDLPKRSDGLPAGISLEPIPAFVPRMVMTRELETVFRQVVLQWAHRERFAGLAKFGIRPLNRLLFFGPPGNGKTMACQWISQQLAMPMYRVRCEELLGSYLGQTTRAIGAITEFLLDLSDTALCLWDEIESIFVDRAARNDSCAGELGSALTVFFQALDRWRSPVLHVMCTNLFERLDAALVSRVELRLEFRGPTAEQAMAVVDYWRELLCEYGADEWGPRFAQAIEESGPPESFRAIQQQIAKAARDWIAAGIKAD